MTCAEPGGGQIILYLARQIWDIAASLRLGEYLGGEFLPRRGMCKCVYRLYTCVYRLAACIHVYTACILKIAYLWRKSQIRL